MNVELLVKRQKGTGMALRGANGPLRHPRPEDVDLLRVLHALSDRTRMEVVRILTEGGERACGTFAVDVSASTLSHHFKVLREAGVVEQRQDGRERITRLRQDELDRRFPHLLDTLVGLYRNEQVSQGPPPPSR